MDLVPEMNRWLQIVEMTFPVSLFLKAMLSRKQLNTAQFSSKFA